MYSLAELYKDQAENWHWVNRGLEALNVAVTILLTSPLMKYSPLYVQLHTMFSPDAEVPPAIILYISIFYLQTLDKSTNRTIKL